MGSDNTLVNVDHKEIMIENKFDTNKDACNVCENERIFLNFLEFT